MKNLKDMTLEELWQLFPIILTEHNPSYKLWYGEEKSQICKALQNRNICRINHIGSTAVCGLLAKPTVDILVELPADYDMDGITELIQALDWGLMSRNTSEKIMAFAKGYTPLGFADRVFHLHVKPHGDWGELYFRDYLRAHGNIAEQYGDLKRQLKDTFEHNRDAYTNAKTEFVLEYTRLARLEFYERYLPE